MVLHRPVETAVHYGINRRHLIIKWNMEMVIRVDRVAVKLLHLFSEYESFFINPECELRIRPRGRSTITVTAESMNDITRESVTFYLKRLFWKKTGPLEVRDFGL
jgi:hypothetical protein